MPVSACPMADPGTENRFWGMALAQIKPCSSLGKIKRKATDQTRNLNHPISSMRLTAPLCVIKVQGMYFCGCFKRCVKAAALLGWDHLSCNVGTGTDLWGGRRLIKQGRNAIGIKTPDGNICDRMNI